MSDDPLTGLTNSARRGKLRRASLMAARVKGPSPESPAQREKLWMLLGCPRPEEMEAFVRFANGYSYGPLGKQAYMHAISLMIDKVNAFGTFPELLEMSFDPDFIPEPNAGEFKRRLIARVKAAKAAKYQRTPTRTGPVAPSNASNSPSENRVKAEQSTMAILEAKRMTALEQLAKSRRR